MTGGHLPRIVPADDPDTYTRGGLQVPVRFRVPVTVTCAACQFTRLRLKVLSNSHLGRPAAERLLTEYLTALGWTRLRDGGADICPECAGTSRDVCEFCRDYTGGHARTCPTQLPGSLL
ncbi:hypothetical protein LV457_02825 [Mycobacterium sp. MYCO198283]|uniref:hypothetical protein n=1 Tax=Mycobacterium sp. MYCO198283 TaxID=2883505 RepID=UPI001E29948C|nr:hypothetical protein [Mycobacterium sp. MYCO198283]MCG5431223.1 hypothetical protein [Mycobacterium sp. MYCO198283]